jgi:hypothetical protein
MPRNPNKARCQVPGCRNWAMRGHSRCRAHRDHELGPRPVGAPAGNLNALKTGQHAHPLPQPALDDLARQLVDEPHLFPYHLGLTAQSLYDRTPDPQQALRAFRATLDDLQPLVTHHQFLADVSAFLDHIPPHSHEEVTRYILASLAPCPPLQRLRTFRQMLASFRASPTPHTPATDDDCF